MATKISVYSTSDLKSTLDDHIPIFLTSPNLPPTSTPLPKPLRLTESNAHTTIRLTIGYTSVLIALYIFYLDYYLKLPWNAHKGVTFYAVAAYFALNGLLTAWIWLGERGIVFAGSRKPGSVNVGAKDGQREKLPVPAMQLKVYSRPPKGKFEPTYHITAEWTLVDAKGNAEKGVVEAEAPFTLFFQADGTFVSGEFERWLKREVSIILGGAKAAAAVAEVIVDTKPAGTVNASTTPATDEPDEDVVVVEAEAPSIVQSGRDSNPGSGTAKKRSRRKA